MVYVIDRMENGMAVLEGKGRRMRNIPLDKLPEGCREGDVVIETTVGFQKDGAASDKRAAEIKKLADSLWES